MVCHQAHPRRGVAAVEVAILTTFLLVPLLIGVWEIGRLVQTKQVVSNAAREGARLAAQSYTINAAGSPTQVKVSGASPSVQEAVYRYLCAAGYTSLEPSDVIVTFAFTAPRSDGLPATEPHQGEKGQPFTVTVRVPWNKVRWVNLGILNPTEVTFTVSWRILVDDEFVIDTTLPTW